MGLSKSIWFRFDLLISSLEVFECIVLVPNVSGSKFIGNDILFFFLSILGNGFDMSIASGIELEVEDFLGLSTCISGG